MQELIEYELFLNFYLTHLIKAKHVQPLVVQMDLWVMAM